MTRRVRNHLLRENVDGGTGTQRTDALVDLLNNALSANLVNLPGLDNVEAAVSVVLVIGKTGEGGTDTGVDVGVVAEKTLLGGVVEVSTVVDGRLLGRRTTEDLGAPGVPK